MQVDFYQLTHDPATSVIPSIAARSMEQGERMLIVSADLEQQKALSAALWSHKPDSFLAHDFADCDTPTRQPILISDRIDVANGAQYLVLADGEWRAEIAAFSRIFYFFEPDKIDNARAVWRQIANDPEAEPHYWRQEGRKWVEGP